MYTMVNVYVILEHDLLEDLLIMAVESAFDVGHNHKHPAVYERFS